MKSPFPGMDPYLEQYWSDVQASLAIYARNHLNRQLPKDLRARVHQSVAVELETPDDVDEHRIYFPDVQVVPSDRPANGQPNAATITTAEPILIPRNAESLTLRSVRIVSSEGYDLVTAIEFLSPANKIGMAGRSEYEQKQGDILRSGASLVEIDLVRAGRHILAFELEKLATRQRSAYGACVIRGWRRKRAEFYPMKLRERLPKIRIPLRKTDADVAIDLQDLIDKAYDDGRYDDLDYAGPLAPKLPRNDEAWADRLLKAAGKR